MAHLTAAKSRLVGRLSGFGAAGRWEVEIRDEGPNPGLAWRSARLGLRRVDHVPSAIYGGSSLTWR
jgi:hypothetical protein